MKVPVGSLLALVGVGLACWSITNDGKGIDIEGQSRCTASSGRNGGKIVCVGDVDFLLEAHATDINVVDPGAGPTAFSLRIKARGYGFGANVGVGYDLEGGVFSPRWDIKYGNETGS